MKFRTSALAVAVCSLLLAGCGGDSEGVKADPAEAASSLDDAKAVVLDYFTKAFMADPAACEHESEAYASLLNEENGVDSCAERVEALEAMLTDDEPFLDVAKSTVEMSEGDDGAAIASVEHEIEGFGGTYALVVVDGAWVIDSEVDAAATGEGGSFGEPQSASEEEVLAIAEAFCDVAVGATRSDIEALMGPPTSEGVDEDGQTELGWYLNQDSYTIWFDDADTVTASSGSSPREDPCVD